jgi:hypothetical protein
MEMGFDTLRGGNRSSAASPAGQPLDWHGLHARLATAHAARRQLLAELAAEPVRGGSFDSDSAGAIFAFGQTLSAINLTALADGKVEAGNSWGVAAAQVPGGRGK